MVHLCYMIPLADGVMIAKAKWEHLLEQPKDSLFVKDTAKAIWGIQCLYNRSVTGAPCRRFLYKEGAPSAPEKKALSPVKMEALRNAFEVHMDKHSSDKDKKERRRLVNRHLADLLKVLKN
ncbi:BEN domain-containing protein 5-like [Rhipicephalus sanguineus]|uniref:BEN domain-containing protein 5-like n=1 Tax=Rhipicephalus sanguineus TaxID=34632 RepID=UPI0020C3AEF9|nr:BEN domain-containing protein 5-like [Rhipicephalus sanguineus]